MQKNLSIFWSKGFIIGLLLLLANDHLLKGLWNNAFTGKLSDLAGLFIFPIFFAAFLPRLAKPIYWITALGFMVWKSPLSNSFIDFFNGLEIFPISRVIDWTDLLTLLILPFSYFYFGSVTNRSFKLNPLPVMILTSFSFIATSRSPGADVEYNKEYSFQFSIDSLQRNVFFLPSITNNYNREGWLYLDSLEKDSIPRPIKHLQRRKKELMEGYTLRSIYIDLKDSFNTCGSPMARITVEQNREISKIKLWDIRYRHCMPIDGKEDKDILLELFEKQVIQPLYD